MSGEESDWISKIKGVGSLSVNMIVELSGKTSLIWAVFSDDNGESTGFKSPSYVLLATSSH